MVCTTFDKMWFIYETTISLVASFKKKMKLQKYSQKVVVDAKLWLSVQLKAKKWGVARVVELRDALMTVSEVRRRREFISHK